MKRLIFKVFCAFNFLCVVKLATALREISSTIGKPAAIKDNERSELLSKIIDELRITTKNSKSKIFHTCDEALSDALNEDGIYQISPITLPPIEPFWVYCMRHPETKKPWTIIQRRMNGKVDFTRPGKEYIKGFGHLAEEYWLGLDRIHALTDSAVHELWIKLIDFENETRSAYYDNFLVNNDHYLKNLGNYSGDVGDSLREGLNEAFYDNYSAFSWWARSQTRWPPALPCSLNGPYSKTSNVEPKSGVCWHDWHGDEYSLKYAHMAIRPVD